MDRFLRPHESDCILLFSKDTTTSKAGRIVNCRNPSPRLVNSTVQEENEFFEKPSRRGKYARDLLNAPRDFPNSPRAGWRFSLPAALSHRRTNRSVNGRMYAKQLSFSEPRYFFGKIWQPMQVKISFQVAAPTGNAHHAPSENRSTRSPEGRMATEAARLKCKDPQKEKNRVETHRPSWKELGSRFGTLRDFPSCSVTQPH